ncbi:PEGA domain-containing protein, partial [bacterium]|nr:PEGA domain-containing protein [bacterium]
MELKELILLAIIGITLAVLPPAYADITSWNLTSPSDLNYTNDTTPSFSFIAVSNNATTFSCTLYINSTGYDSNSSVSNNTETTLTANTSLSDGQYKWWINCTDNTTTKSPNRTITIDTIYPSVSYVNPPTNGNAYETVTIKIQKSDTNLHFCYLVWNGATESFDNTNTTHSWETKQLQQGQKYTFYAYCTDRAGQKNTTSTLTIYGKQVSGGGGGGIISVPVRITTSPQAVYLTIYDSAGNVVYKGLFRSGNQISLPYGTYKVILEAEGYPTTTEYITVKRATSYNFELSQTLPQSPISNISTVFIILFLAGIG